MSTTKNVSGQPPKSMVDLLNGFVIELRNAGLPVSLTENLDAMEAIQYIPIEDRDAFKYALGATLIKNNSHWRAFETVFEVYFSLRGPEYKLAEGDESELDDLWREMQEQQQGEGSEGGGAMDALTPEEIAQMLMQALLNGDQAMMRAQSGRAAGYCSASRSWSDEARLRIASSYSSSTSGRLVGASAPCASRAR